MPPIITLVVLLVASSHGHTMRSASVSSLGPNATKEQQLRQPQQQPSAACDAFACGNSTGCMPLRFMLGAQKSGSSSLWNMLRSITAMCGPQCEEHRPAIDHTAAGAAPTARLTCLNPKESQALMHGSTHCPISPSSACNDHTTDPDGAIRRGYTALWPQHRCRSGCALEATPNYLFDPTTPRVLHAIMTKAEAAAARFLVVLREPVARELAWYNHVVYGYEVSKVSWGIPKSVRFEELVEVGVSIWNQCLRTLPFNWTELLEKRRNHTTSSNASDDAPAGPNLGIARQVHAYDVCRNTTSLANSMFAPQLMHWMKAFTRKQFLVLRFESMISSDIFALQNQLLTFFGLRANRELLRSFPRTNTHDSPLKVSRIECRAKAMLSDMYQPWNELLYDVFPSVGRFDEKWSAPCFHSHPAEDAMGVNGSAKPPEITSIAGGVRRSDHRIMDAKRARTVRRYAAQFA